VNVRLNAIIVILFILLKEQRALLKEKNISVINVKILQNGKNRKSILYNGYLIRMILF
jgi:hypothetical protein